MFHSVATNTAFRQLDLKFLKQLSELFGEGHLSKILISKDLCSISDASSIDGLTLLGHGEVLFFEASSALKLPARARWLHPPATKHEASAIAGAFLFSLSNFFRPFCASSKCLLMQATNKKVCELNLLLSNHRQMMNFDYCAESDQLRSQWQVTEPLTWVHKYLRRRCPKN